MDRWVGRVALVTGGSSGIGAGIAEALTKHGMTVVACARNIDKINELATQLGGEKGKLHAVKCDLTKEEEILSMFKEIETKHGGVDVCVNNAGLAHIAPLTSAETCLWKNMMDVNVMALCICTREAVKSMRARGVDDGQVIHISSMNGHFPTRSSAGHFYSATKCAVTSLLEGLRRELRELKSHIRISAISPGQVETDFAHRMVGSERAQAQYASIECLQPEDIANAVTYVLTQPPHVQVHEVQMRPTEQKAY